MCSLSFSACGSNEIISDFQGAVAALPRSYGTGDRPNLNTLRTAFSETIGEYATREPTGLSEAQTIKAMSLAHEIHKARNDTGLFA
ncbi:MAG: hypothetical protein O2962_05725, partial [Cyanobacteria bacterium]|nr:hypothetical protein [Cyanobacteriota bacterium]